jgi:hypothetical protein
MGAVARSFSLVLLFSLTGWAQSAGNADATFHLEGTIRGPRNIIVEGVEIRFDGDLAQKSVITDRNGSYSTSLPLGSYTMMVVAPKPTAQALTAFRDYVRPLFRVTSPQKIILNGTLYPFQLKCDVVLLDGAGNPVTDEEQLKNTRKNACGSQDFFPDSSQPDSPFQISVTYPQRYLTSEGFLYKSAVITGTKSRTQVFVAYNLFSLAADEVAFNQKDKIIEAKGNVLIEDGSTARRFDAANFRMDNGQVISAALQ